MKIKKLKRAKSVVLVCNFRQDMAFTEKSGRHNLLNLSEFMLLSSEVCYLIFACFLNALRQRVSHALENSRGIFGKKKKKKKKKKNLRQ